MNIFIIGAGGIGSFLSYHLDRLIELKQISKDYKFNFYDDDKVELKNILYQNFKSGDIDSYKTDALSLRYFNLNFFNKRLSYKDLQECGLVVLCADNNKIRQETWENWVKNKIPFIDSRANGRAIGIFSNETENYLNTLSKDTKSTSCQNPFQIAKKEIEYGNVIISTILAQCILNFCRTEKLPLDFQAII
jgi:hypothetical protein